MPALNTLQASKTKRILVYGPPKSGKTELVGGLAEKMKLIWIDGENGKDTLFKLPVEWQKNIDMFSIPDTRAVPMMSETCLKIIKAVPGTICLEHGKFECPICKTANKERNPVDVGSLIGKLDHCLVFDSLTQLTSSAINQITRGKPDDYKLDYDDWGNLGKIMDIFLSQVQAARFNVVCISHETPVEMNDGKEKLVPTAGTRNFSRNTAKYFDEVVYASVVNKAHKFASATTYANNILTGSRSGKRLEDSKEPKLLELF